jgi:hypothetical protein
VRGLKAVAVRLLIGFRAWYLSSCPIVLDCVPCVVLEQWLCGSESNSLRGLRIVAVC